MKYSGELTGNKKYSGEHMATKSTVENIWRQNVQCKTYGDKKYSGEHMATKSTVENIIMMTRSRAENMSTRSTVEVVVIGF